MKTEQPENRTIENAFDNMLTKLYLSAAIFLLAGFVFFNVVSTFDVFPRFCGQCHRSSYSTWNSSNHATVKCRVCHNGPTVFGTISGRIQLAGMIPSALISKYQKPITAFVSSEVCLKCHNNIKSKVIRKKLLIVSHKEIIEAGFECDVCHSTVVHSDLAARQNKATMEKCLSCHNNVVASGKCEVCHTKVRVVVSAQRFTGPWQITHGKNWRELHGMGNLSTCQTCHSKLFCSRCHTIELPHPTAWLATHGKQVVNSDAVKNSCSKCHQGALCKNCHKIKIPHPSDFLNKHSKLVKKTGADVCYGCHQKEACTKCHAFHIHPGIPQSKLKVLRKEAGLD